MAKGRQHTADEKLKILEEARQPGTTVAEVLRRHPLDATTFYRWERQAKNALREAFSEQPRSTVAKDREIERLKAEVARESRVIAEVVEVAIEMKSNVSGVETALAWANSRLMALHSYRLPRAVVHSHRSNGREGRLTSRLRRCSRFRRECTIADRNWYHRR